MANKFCQIGTAIGLVGVVFVMYERWSEEREVFHKMHAGRVAYLSGIAVLTVALVVQGFAHAIDPWISAALGAMVISKLVARFYSEQYR